MACVYMYGAGAGAWNRMVGGRTDPKVIPRFKAIVVQWKREQAWKPEGLV